MNTQKLNREEQELLDAFEADEFKSDLMKNDEQNLQNWQRHRSKKISESIFGF